VNMPLNDNEFAHSAPLFCGHFDTRHMECCLDNCWGYILENKVRKKSLWSIFVYWQGTNAVFTDVYILSL